jgi:cyclopropane-fatty-acyl-phospholipid synthase
MIYKFKSKAAADLIMLEVNGRQLLKILEKNFPEQQAQGVLTVAQMPRAIQAIEEAIAAEDRAHAEAAQAGSPQGAARLGISLRQRLAPFLAMVRRCMQANEPIVWGV